MATNEPTSHTSTNHDRIVRPGVKSACPFCGHTTFYTKKDGSLSKCFHPSCGRFITARTDGRSEIGFLQPALQHVFRDSHTQILAQKESESHTAYSYLVGERQIHPQVVQDSMLGVVPDGHSLDDAFELISTKTDNEKLAIKITEARGKLESCLNGHSGWLCFFYTDQYHRITSIKFRQPYTRNFVYFKPFDRAGVFGHGMFKPDPAVSGGALTENLLVVEGEVNQLQLQSLLIRYCEKTANNWDYVPACAVGGVSSADFETLAAVCSSPVICYDNDVSGAGYQLVNKAREYVSLHAFTTPGQNSDLDSYIRSLHGNHESAWESLKTLVSKARPLSKLYSGVAKEVFHARQNHGWGDSRREFEINAQVATIIGRDLNDRGRFYWNPVDAYFFNDDDKKLIRLHKDDIECTQLLHRYGINRTERIFGYLIDDFRVAARKNGTGVQPYRMALYDQEHFALYLYNNDNQVYRIRTGSIELVDNGADGVMFLSDSRAESFTIGPSAPRTSLLDRTIFSKIPLADDNLSAAERRLMFSLWFYSLFFGSIMPTKPILAFVGEKGSGKSSTLRRVGKLLFGSRFDVMPLPQKVEDFDAAVSNSAFVAIDNADSRVKWLEDRLATVATGGTIRRRQLYTDNNIIEMPVHCSLAITSRTPHFKRDDVADRLLIMRVERIRDFSSESDRIREVL